MNIMFDAFEYRNREDTGSHFDVRLCYRPKDEKGLNILVTEKTVLILDTEKMVSNQNVERLIKRRVMLEVFDSFIGDLLEGKIKI